MHKPTQPNKTWRPALLWAGSYACALGAAAVLVYAWRVFYSYGLYPFAALPAAGVLGGLAAVITLFFAAAFALHRFGASFAAKAACAILGAAMLFAFVTPPLQAPDESSQFLRTLSVSQGHFDYDANRTYSQDVAALMNAFGFAWGNAHDGEALKVRVDKTIANPSPSQTQNGEAILQQFSVYEALQTQALAPIGEPLFFMYLPLLPQALFVFFAKLFGANALAMLYTARVANCLVYAALCYAALRQTAKYRFVFLALMLMPMSLFCAGIATYEGVLFGAVFFLAGLVLRKEFGAKQLMWFLVVFALLSMVKLNNILCLALLLFVPRSAWKCKWRKWQCAACVATACALAMLLSETIMGAMTHNYPPPYRVIGGADVAQQLQFVLHNPLRTVAVFLGTLFENNFFLFDTARFGYLDISLPLVSALAVLVLVVCAALSAQPEHTLAPRTSALLAAWAALYAAAVMGGLYLTYTPVSMVRVVGLQPRYFMPVFLVLFVLLAAGCSRVLTLQNVQRAESICLTLCTAFGCVGALLLFQIYYVGPVAIAALGA